MGFMLQAAEFVWSLVADLLEMIGWREDWNRTWSPVSWWLMVLTGLGVIGCLWAAIAWGAF